MLKAESAAPLYVAQPSNLANLYAKVYHAKLFKGIQDCEHSLGILWDSCTFQFFPQQSSFSNRAQEVPQSTSAGGPVSLQGIEWLL